MQIECIVKHNKKYHKSIADSSFVNKSCCLQLKKSCCLQLNCLYSTCTFVHKYCKSFRDKVTFGYMYYCL